MNPRRNSEKLGTFFHIRLPIMILGLLLITGGPYWKEKAETAPPPAALSQTRELPTTTLDISGETFVIELAYRHADRMRGLMFRGHLPADHGMLFIFPRSRPQTFYMQNCLVDIDVLFLAADGEIVSLHGMKVPKPGAASRLYHSVSPCRYALELPAGTIERLKLRIGQKIMLNEQIRNILPDPE
jgi:uncharacterized protein